MADKEFDLAANVSEASKIFKKLQSDLNKPASSGSVYDIIFHSSDYAKAMTGELMGNLIKQQSSLFEKLKQSESSYKNQVSNTKEIEKRLSKLQTLSKTLAIGSTERAKIERQILETQSDLEESVGKEEDYEQAIIQYKKSIVNVNQKILDKEKEISSVSASAAATASDNLINKIKTLPILQQEKQYQDLINTALNERENLEAKLATLGDVLGENGKVLVDRSKDRLEVETQIEQLNAKIAEIQQAEAKSSEVAAKLAAQKLSTASEYATKIAKNSEEQANADREAAERHRIQTQQDIEDLKAKEKAAYKAEHGNLKGYKQSDALKEELKGIRKKAKEEQKILDNRAKASEAQARKDADEARKLARQQEDADAARKKRLESMSKIQQGPAKLGDKAIAKQREKVADAEKRAQRSGEDIMRLEDELKNSDLSKDERAQKEQELEAAKKENAQAKRDGMMADNMARAMEGLQNTMEQAFNELNAAMDDYNKYAAKIDARIQGSDSDYEDVIDLVKSNLALSPLVKTKEVMEKINEAVDSGITYNLEQRAFLESISDKIASTFDAFDANLLRLIRLQQADSTAARLGMEATLTQMLNSMYDDSSYLTSNGAADSVAGAIIDAQSQMSRDQALEFEFTVQKWLGSLGSLGMSNETLTKIAEGINYLGTGNVEALSSNEDVQTLIAMSASEAGLSLADMLVQGLTSSDTNKLLKSMVEYLKEIAEGDNQVVKSAYGGIFSMSQSDMRSIQNMTAGDINSIAAQSLTYNQAMGEAQKQMFMAAARTPISEMMENVYDNLISSIAAGIAENPATMAAWKLNDFVEKQTGGINIPFLNVYGFGLDLNANINQLIKLGMAGASLLTQAPAMISSIANLGGMNLDGWDAEEYTSRGSGFVGITQGASSTTSQSSHVGSASSDDAQNSTLSNATEDSKESSKVTNAGMDQEHTFDEFYKALLEDKEFVRAEVKFPDDYLPMPIRVEEFADGIFDSIIDDAIITARLMDDQIGALTKDSPTRLVDEQLTELINSFAAIMAVYNTKINLEPDLATGAPALSVSEQYKNAYIEKRSFIDEILDGSHASGLTNVPHDGYIAELHEGEAVLTKTEADSWRGQNMSSPAAITNLDLGQTSSQYNMVESITTLSDILVSSLGDNGPISTLLGPSGAINNSLINIENASSNINSSLGLEGLLNTSLGSEGAISDAIYASSQATTNSLLGTGSVSSAVAALDANNQASALASDILLDNTIRELDANTQMSTTASDTYLGAAISTLDEDTQAAMSASDLLISTAVSNMDVNNQLAALTSSQLLDSSISNLMESTVNNLDESSPIYSQLLAENEQLASMEAAESDAAAASLAKTTDIYNDLFNGSSAKQLNVSIRDDDAGIVAIKSTLSQILLALIGSGSGDILSALNNSNKNTAGLLNALGATSEDTKGQTSIASLIDKLYELSNDSVGFKTHVANPLSGASGEALDTMAYVLTLGGAL